jgi:hypothetical protein
MVTDHGTTTDHTSIDATTTLYEHVGGRDGHPPAVVATSYPTVLYDSLLQPLFGSEQADHVRQLTAFL